MTNASETRVPCSRVTRERLWNAKRDGETFDTLFSKMLRQYDPDDAGNGETNKPPA